MNENATVSMVQESPTRQKMSVGVARKYHKKEGFREYVGPKLKGERFELGIKDVQFPDALRRIPRPPATIYGIGNLDALQEGLAIVGARKATPYGRECAKRFGQIAARKGIVIISGGARGCDSEAHSAALSVGAPTVVIFGGGCDYIYPAENFDLFQRVVDVGGAVISENEWGYPAMPYSFRERNRLIAGLARATLIVEAGMPSGTFSTADEALAASREVLAVPGAITSKTSKGANHLIYQGATPIVDDASFEDVLFSIYGCLKNSDVEQTHAGFSVDPSNKIDKQFLSVFEAISARPTSIDEMCSIIKKTPVGYESVLSWLLVQLEGMESAGKIVRLPDGRYVARL